MLPQSEMEFSAVLVSVDPEGGKRHEQDQSTATIPGQEKEAILRRHLVEKVPVSGLSEAYGIHPTLFYQWKKIGLRKGPDKTS